MVALFFARPPVSKFLYGRANTGKRRRRKGGDRNATLALICSDEHQGEVSGTQGRGSAGRTGTLEPAPIKHQAATARISFGRGRSAAVSPNAGPKRSLEPPNHQIDRRTRADLRLGHPCFQPLPFPS